VSQIAKIPAGRDVPNDVNVIIEIPAQSKPVKYEMDKTLGLLCVDRFLTTAMHYPCNYGYVPGTLSEDGDPVDVLVVTPFPLFAGSLIRVRPIGLLQMEDERGVDAKILAVPINELSPLYGNVQKPEDLPLSLLDTIRHFFEHYKDLEDGKWVKINKWLGSDAARAEIMSSIKRYGK
jgi:inorganic pyrophosphatase